MYVYLDEIIEYSDIQILKYSFSEYFWGSLRLEFSLG